MEIPPWQISWQVAPSRQVRRLICLVARCAARCATLPGAPPNARFAGKSLVLLNNLKHWYQTKIEPIVQSCIRLFKINMHPLYIRLLTLFLIYLNVFLIKTPLIHLINIIIIIFFLNFWTLLIICYIKTTNIRSSVLWLSFYWFFIIIYLI